MPGRRRPALAIEADRRRREISARIGGELKLMRTRRSWTQGDLAERAGLGRMVVNRLERGATSTDIDVLVRISLVLNAPLNIAFGRDPRADVADAGHLGMQELLLRFARQNGYVGGLELPTRPAEPWRSVDVVLAAAGRQRMICVECWNTIGDIGAAVRGSARKAAELEQLAVGRWGEDAKVGLVWVIRASARNRALVGRYP